MKDVVYLNDFVFYHPIDQPQDQKRLARVLKIDENGFATIRVFYPGVNAGDSVVSFSQLSVIRVFPNTLSFLKFEIEPSADYGHVYTPYSYKGVVVSQRGILHKGVGYSTGFCKADFRKQISSDAYISDGEFNWVRFYGDHPSLGDVNRLFEFMHVDEKEKEALLIEAFKGYWI